ncbi:hypothetical protein GYMLUDRAFT_41682 [Collybiopsis luxurians FD-317 M1]|uniref:Uncharacterized protein n=1 Tax=Collybiopsis luxurians FD-317 M1 TaxID=944289 RepID=A0A0D0D137_9AGAR|nr:hypothetical protein GYMLUDRAFT_41682 [Collybiopsis luxurians FD-317 M1]
MPSFFAQTFRVLLSPTSPTYGLTKLWSSSSKLPRIASQLALSLTVGAFSYDLLLKIRMRCRFWLVERCRRQLLEIQEKMQLCMEDQQRLSIVMDFMELPFPEEDLSELIERKETGDARVLELMEAMKALSRTLQWTLRFM